LVKSRQDVQEGGMGTLGIANPGAGFDGIGMREFESKTKRDVPYSGGSAMPPGA